LAKGQVSLCSGAASGIWHPVSVCQLFPLKVYYSRTAQQNLIKFGVKRHWGKGNQFYINEGAGPPGARGVGPDPIK